MNKPLEWNPNVTEEHLTGYSVWLINVLRWLDREEMRELVRQLARRCGLEVTEKQPQKG